MSCPRTKLKRHATQSILIMVGALLLMGCASLPGANYVLLSVSVGRPFVLTKSHSGYGWGYLSHPMACGGDGYAFVSYNLQGDTDWPGPVPDEFKGLGPAATTNGGSSWVYGGAAQRIYSDRKCHGVFCEKLGLVEPPPLTAFGLNESPGHSTPRGVLMPDGTILFVAYGFKGDEKRFRTALTRSVDGGKTFMPYTVIATGDDAPWGGDGPCEPALAGFPNGELLCIMRTGIKGQASTRRHSSDMLEARSTDGGRTWKKKRMVLPGVMPRFLQMSNGVLVMGFGAPGNNLVFSMDEGRTWGREIALSLPTAQTSGYVDMVEIAPGRLLVVYDMLDEPLTQFWLWEPKRGSGIIARYIDVHPRF